jgi:AbrB family looped-hinge helix DNA binding protein
LTTVIHLFYHFTMKTTIDGSGRLVIPKRLREQFHFGDGATIEILAEDDGLRLRLPQATGRLVEKEGVLVQQADSVSPLDATAFINQQRHSRSLQIPTSEVGE